MKKSSYPSLKKDRCTIVAVFFVLGFIITVFSGCVANDQNLMPWAAPDPNDGSVNLPGSYFRQ